MSSAAHRKVVFVIFLSLQSNICRFSCVISTLTKKLNFDGSSFTLIFAVSLVKANYYETRVLDSSYLRYKVQLPTSDSTENPR